MLFFIFAPIYCCRSWCIRAGHALSLGCDYKRHTNSQTFPGYCRHAEQMLPLSPSRADDIALVAKSAPEFEVMAIQMQDGKACHVRCRRRRSWQQQGSMMCLVRADASFLNPTFESWASRLVQTESKRGLWLLSLRSGARKSVSSVGPSPPQVVVGLLDTESRNGLGLRVMDVEREDCREGSRRDKAHGEVASPPPENTTRALGGVACIILDMQPRLDATDGRSSAGPQNVGPARRGLDRMVATSTRDASGQGLGMAQQPVQCGRGRIVQSCTRPETGGMPKQKGGDPRAEPRRHVGAGAVACYRHASLVESGDVGFFRGRQHRTNPQRRQSSALLSVLMLLYLACSDPEMGATEHTLSSLLPLRES